MEILSKKEFEKLAEYRGENCVSIYIPTHRAGKEVNNGKDAILFKNQLQKVKNQLTDRGWSEKEVREFLEPAYRLHEDTNFWHQQLEGLAVFIAEDLFSYHRIPMDVEEFCSLTTSFNLLPLVPLFSGDGLYYILGVSMDKVRLMEATRHYIREIDTGDTLQQGIIEVFKYYDFGKQVYNKSSSQGGGYMDPSTGSAIQGGGGPNPSGNRGGANFHGQGDNQSDSDHLIKEYFRNLNEGLSRYIHNQNIPIVLAAVDYLHPLFLEASNGFNFRFAKKGITGNTDTWHIKDLHKRSLECVEDYFQKEQEKSRKAYNDLAGTGRTSYDINEIVPAAINGRIDSLFVADRSHTWGRFDMESQDVEIHEDFQYGDDDLVNRSAVATILNSGQTFVVDKNELPDKTVNADMVAVLRY